MKNFTLIFILILVTSVVKSQTFFKVGASLTNPSKVWIHGQMGYQLKGNNIIEASVFTNVTRNIWVASYGTNIFKRISGHVGLALQDQKVSPYVGMNYNFRKRYSAGLAWTDKTRFFTIGVKFK